MTHTHTHFPVSWSFHSLPRQREEKTTVKHLLCTVAQVYTLGGFKKLCPEIVCLFFQLQIFLCLYVTEEILYRITAVSDQGS